MFTQEDFLECFTEEPTVNPRFQPGVTYTRAQFLKAVQTGKLKAADGYGRAIVDGTMSQLPVFVGEPDTLPEDAQSVIWVKHKLKKDSDGEPFR